MPEEDARSAQRREGSALGSMLTRLVEMVSFILSKSMEYEDEDWGTVKTELTELLEGRGFKDNEIDVAFEVANRIRSRIEVGASIAFPFKTNLVYQYLEQIKLSTEARGFLAALLHAGAITPQQREEVVERAFFMETTEVDREDIEYIVTLVLGGDSWIGEDSPSMSYTLQ